MFRKVQNYTRKEMIFVQLKYKIQKKQWIIDNHQGLYYS